MRPEPFVRTRVESRDTSTRIIARILWRTFAFLAVLGTCTRADAEIFLNELVTRPSTQASVEIYNSGPNAVSLHGWKIAGSKGTIPLSQTIILPGEHKVIAGLGDIFEPIGGWAGIIDDVNTMQDRVRYGNVGGAPAPPTFGGFGTVTLCRSPDASNPEAPRRPALDGRFWTLDLTGTMGGANDVPNPDLGRDICINELFLNPNATLADSVEFCGPASAAPAPGVDINGWYLTTAYGVQFLSGIVPAGGFLGHEVDPDLQLDQALRIDLFDSNGVRVYQKGFDGAPPSICYGDCPDGAAPPDGWNWTTSGGGVTFFPLLCSIGFPNWVPGQVCGILQADRSWGSIKQIFHEGAPDPVDARRR